MLNRIRRGEAGQVLPIVLIMLALGSLLVVPSLNYVSTSLKAGEMIEENVEGLYAAEAGVEDALWKIKNDKPASFPYSYQLTNVNGMSVDVVIDELTTFAGEEIGATGGSEDWLVITKSITYDSGIYTYILSLTNSGSGNIKVGKILIDFPPNLEYVAGSTGGYFTTGDAAVFGDPTMGITLSWDFPEPQPTIKEGATEDHIFQLSGPPDVEGVEGHGFVKAIRENVAFVWDADSAHPYQITAQAKDASNAVVATIRAGVWAVGQLSISCWQVNPLPELE